MSALVRVRVISGEVDVLFGEDAAPRTWETTNDYGPLAQYRVDDGALTGLSIAGPAGITIQPPDYRIPVPDEVWA